MNTLVISRNIFFVCPIQLIVVVLMLVVSCYLVSERLSCCEWCDTEWLHYIKWLNYQDVCNVKVTVHFLLFMNLHRHPVSTILSVVPMAERSGQCGAHCHNVCWNIFHTPTPSPRKNKFCFLKQFFSSTPLFKLQKTMPKADLTWKWAQFFLETCNLHVI